MNLEVEDFKTFLFNYRNEITGNLQGAKNGMVFMSNLREQQLMEKIKFEFPELFKMAEKNKILIEHLENKRFSRVLEIWCEILGKSFSSLNADDVLWLEYHWDFNAIILLMMDAIGIDKVKSIIFS